MCRRRRAAHSVLAALGPQHMARMDGLPLAEQGRQCQLPLTHLQTRYMRYRNGRGKGSAIHSRMCRPEGNVARADHSQ